MEKEPTNKRLGGYERAELAREELKLVLLDDSHAQYFSKDLEYAKRYDVSRHTIYKIRDELKVGSRSERIVEKLKKIDTKDMTVNGLSQLLGIKYQNLYKIVIDFKIPIRMLK